MSIFESSGFVKTRECAELNLISQAVGWDANYTQLGKGEFEGGIEYCISPEIRVTNQFNNRGIVATGLPPKNYLALLLPERSGVHCIFQGRPVAETEALVMRPGSESTMRTCSDFGMITVSVNWPRFRSAFRNLTHRKVSQFILDSGEFDLPGDLRLSLRQLALKMLEQGKNNHSSHAASLVLSELEDEFLNTLSIGVTHLDQDSMGVLGRRNRMSYLELAREYIESNLKSPLGIETLASATGVTSRTLCSVFRETLNTTPLNYIKSRRLSAVRQALLKTDTEDITVAQVANEYGFSHLGHFSRDYKLLFGELPSSTLKSGRKNWLK